MATLTLNNIDDGLALELRLRASQSCRSLEDEALAIISAALRGQNRSVLSPVERVARARAISSLGPQHQTTDSVSLLREERSL